MVGSGFSKNATPNSASCPSFPNWDELGDEFYKKLHGRMPDESMKYLNVLKLADEVQAQFGRPALNQLLRDVIPDTDYEPSPLHKKLLSLSWSDVFTTNFDTLLERACASITSPRYDIVVNKEDLVYSGKPRIVKLHGSFPSERPFIITEEDYRRYPDDHGPFVNTVRQSLLENTLCLIGFSGEDPNFLQWIGWIRDNLGRLNSPRIFLIGVFSLSDAQIKLLEERNILLVDMSESLTGVDSNNIHYAGLKLFLNYLEETVKSDNRLEWPDEREFTKTENVEEKVAETKRLLEHWRRQRVLYPGWLIVPKDCRESLWAATEDWCNHLTESDSLSDFLDLEFSYELSWRMDKCLCSVLDYQVTFFESILNKYNFLLSSTTPSVFYDFSIEEIHQRGLELSDFRKMLHHLLMWMLRFYREEGWLEKWSETNKLIEKHKEQFSQELIAGHYYEQSLYALFRLDLTNLKKTLSQWPEFQNLHFWEVKKAGLYAEIGNMDVAKRILVRSLSNVRSKLNLKPVTSDYSLVSHESWIMILLKNVELSEAFADRDKPLILESDRKYVDRWNDLKQFKCDPQGELVFFESTLGRTETAFSGHSSVTEKDEFDIGSVTLNYRVNPPKELLIAYNYLRLCEDAGLPFSIPRLTLSKTAAEGAIVRVSETSPFWAMATLVRIGDQKTVDHIFDRASLSNMKMSSVDSLVVVYLESLKQSEADIELGDAFYESNFGITLANVIPEILSRLCCKCSTDSNLKLIDFLRGVYGSKVRFKYRGIRKLISRLADSMSIQQQYELIPSLLDFQTNENPTPIEKHEYVNPFAFISRNVIQISKSSTAPKIPSVKIRTLNEQAFSTNVNVRVWAIQKIAVLYELGWLSDSQILRFSESLWSQVDEYGLPSNTEYNRYRFIDLPHPDSIEPIELIKKYIHASQFPIVRYPSDKGITLIRGNIPLCNDIIFASRRIEWSVSDSSAIFDRLVEWWEADKGFLRMVENPGPFGSLKEEFASRFAIMIDVLVAILKSDYDLKGRRDQLQRMIAEFCEYEIPSLRLESASLRILPKLGDHVLNRIDIEMASDVPAVVDDSLEAFLDFVDGNESNPESSDLSKPVNTMGQIVRLGNGTTLPNVLSAIIKIVKRTPSIFSGELERLTLLGLGRIVNNTDVSSDSRDIAKKLIVRQKSARLAYEIHEYYSKRGDSMVPEEIKKWKAVVSSESEFAEIRNQWT